MKKSIICISACLLLVACQNDETPSEPVMKPRADIQLTTNEKLMVDKNNEFAFSLFRQITSDDAAVNVSISPFSASICLSMIANGAKGETAAEMYDVLGFKNFSQEEMNAFNKKMCESLLDVDPSTQFALANAIWVAEGCPVKSEFQEANKVNYDATVQNLNFADPNALQIINDWCAEHTNNRIENILTELSSNLRLLLANALYFKGSWVSKFDKGQTQKAEFTNAGGNKTNVDMMHQEHSFPYREIEEVQIAEFPYGNGAFSMLVILPKNEEGMNTAINTLLTSTHFDRLKDMQSCLLNVSLPKFRVEFERLMNDDLISLGMQTCFDKDADFSRMADEDLLLGFVKQKTFIEVNEEGTEAAAVTVGGMLNSTGPVTPTSFIVDKPFIYLIKEKSTGAILFIGKIEKL